MRSKGENARERVRKYGPGVVQREEMMRLGFLKVDSGQDLNALMTELQSKLRELRKVDTRIEEAQDVETLIKEIRGHRIEEVERRKIAHRAAKVETATAKREAQERRKRETPPFLGHGVSAGLDFTGGDALELRKQRLPEVTNAVELAAAIGIESGELSWLCYHRGAARIDHYIRFAIPKRSGKTRVISSPKARLRVAQSWVNTQILEQIEVHRAAFVFRPKRSIADNAYMHCKKAIVVRLDLEDFFPSVTFPRIRGIFRSFGYNDGVATMLALLTSEAPRMPLKMDVPGDAGRTRYVAVGERQLPQGACTSPALSNIICWRLDTRLAGFAKRHDWTYTRYADDLVFSHLSAEADVGRLLGTVRHIVSDEDFRVNADKTRVMRAHQRQTVTGLVVDKEPRVSRRDMRRFRAF